MGLNLSRSLRLPLRCATMTMPAMPAHALSILPCNDDGITAANLRALEQALARAGHGIVLTGPVDSPSGRGGFVEVSPVLGLTEGSPANCPPRLSLPPPVNPCSASS